MATNSQSTIILIILFMLCVANSRCKDNNRHEWIAIARCMSHCGNILMVSVAEYLTIVYMEKLYCNNSLGNL